eukprot:tig00000361_g24421.t1
MFGALVGVCGDPYPADVADLLLFVFGLVYDQVGRTALLGPDTSAAAAVAAASGGAARLGLDAPTSFGPPPAGQEPPGGARPQAPALAAAVQVREEAEAGATCRVPVDVLVEAAARALRSLEQRRMEMLKARLMALGDPSRPLVRPPAPPPPPSSSSYSPPISPPCPPLRSRMQRLASLDAAMETIVDTYVYYERDRLSAACASAYDHAMPSGSGGGEDGAAEEQPVTADEFAAMCAVLDPEAGPAKARSAFRRACAALGGAEWLDRAQTMQALKAHLLPWFTIRSQECMTREELAALLAADAEAAEAAAAEEEAEGEGGEGALEEEGDEEGGGY